MMNLPPDNQRSIRFLVPALLLTCGAILLFWGVDTRPLRAWLQQAGPWAPLAFIVIGVAAMTVLVPKTAVSVTAGALFGSLQGSLLLLVIAVTAAAFNYAIGRWWLYDSIDRKLRALGQDAARSSSQTDRPDWGSWMRAAGDVARNGGFRFHLLLRLAPIPTTLISYAMGASGSRLCPFLMAAAVAVVPQMLWVHGGTAAILINDPHSGPLRWAGVVLSVLAAIAITVFIPLAIKRHQTRETSIEPHT